MHLKSSAFNDGGIIPSIYTCEGKNISPPLEIEKIPKEAKSLVLIVDDPDANNPEKMYDHWVVFNILPTCQKITEKTFSPGIHGNNSAGKNQYTGPCPPLGVHRYFFKLYALDTMLDLSPGATKGEVEKAMEGHILTECQLMGRYEKGRGY